MLFETIHQPLWPRRWLQLAVLSLALSGIFSIILVVSRTPQLIALFPWMGELFSVSLVIHVDLSVLIWFLSITGLLWSLLVQYTQIKTLPFAQAAAWASVLLGTLFMAASPLTGEWEVIKANYIPVITNSLFFGGVSLVLAGMLVALVQTLFATPKESSPEAWGIYSTLLIAIVALGCFTASANGIPEIITGHAFYETLFWAGGHVLQFVYMQICLIAWIALARTIGYTLPSKAILYILLAIGPIAATWSFVPYLIFPVISQEHMDFFTLKMNVALGAAGILLGLWLTVQIVQSPRKRSGACEAAIKTSLILFFVGGLFGALIDGPNVKIPAHYHGSIVSVSLALMGLAYYMLPKLGGKEVAQWRMARWQPWFYAIGQLLHITGLAISGGYGVLRKTVGDTGDGGWEVMAALGMMGGGGILAIIGGLLFVIVMVKGFRR